MPAVAPHRPAHTLDFDNTVLVVPVAPLVVGAAAAAAGTHVVGMSAVVVHTPHPHIVGAWSHTVVVVVLDNHHVDGTALPQAVHPPAVGGMPVVHTAVAAVVVVHTQGVVGAAAVGIAAGVVHGC